MNFRNLLRSLFSALAFALLVSCGKSSLNSSAELPAAWKPSPDTVARIHWLGRGRLDLDAGAYYVSRVWSLPETSRLQQQISDKLATNVWRFLLGDAAATQIPATAFRPMLDDVALEESYFEMRIPTNSQASQSCFAIHLPPERFGPWVTNLAIAAELLTGGPATSDSTIHGWTIKGAKTVNHVMLSHIGEWILVAIGSDKNPVFDEVADRIVHSGAPVPEGATNFWLEANIDLSQTARALSLPWKTPAGLPRINLNVTGDGSHVITRGQLTFPEPFSNALETWHIPTNLIHEPLLGFTAVRGIQPFLAKWKTWDNLQIGAPPDQLIFWSLSDSPYQTYAAAPWTDASREMSVITDLLLQKGNPWLATNGYINFNRAPDSNGVVWGDMAAIKPFIKSVDAGNDSWLYAGLLPDPGSATNAPLSNQIVQNLIQQTNLVYYDWELTGDLLSPRLVLGQTIRQVARRPQMPADCTSLNCLGVLIPRLGPSETTITQSAPNELTFYRKSTVGFTAVELHLLADWLESPQFPLGLHSLP